jgi:hypothetical protein
MLSKLLEAALELRSGWSCGDETENRLHHHNCNKKSGCVQA